MKCAEERRNLISKPNLTLKVSIESIRTYKAIMKENTCYKGARARVYNEVRAQKQKIMQKMWEMPQKKKKTAMILTRSVEGAMAYSILRTIVSQRHMYDKGEIIA